MNEQDLRIDAEHPITAADVGRWLIGANGLVLRVRDWLGADLLNCGSVRVTHGYCFHLYKDGRFSFAAGRPEAQNADRWLSRAECRERGLACTHPTQIWDEPAREGESCTTPPAGLPTPQESSPPAPDDQRLADFFRDKRPLPVPFELGRKVEHVARREACPCCVQYSGQTGRAVEVLNGDTWRDCPECDGRGWQEVK